MDICLTVTAIDWQLTKDVVAIIGSFVSIFGVAAAFAFGLRGLSAWRKQLRGNVDHALAIKVLVELYRFRDALNYARVPMFTLEDLNFARVMISETDKQNSYLVLSQSLVVRYEKISVIKATLEAAAVECEAMWGRAFAESIEALFSLYSELVLDAERFSYLEDPRISEDRKSTYKMFKGDRANVIFDDGRKQSNEFTERFISAIKVIESKLKEKIV